MTKAQELGEAILAMTASTTIAKSRTFDLAMKDFPTEAILAFITYGAQRKFNDAVGGAMRGDEVYTPEMKVADAEALIADFKAGKVSKRREGGGGVTDEVSAGRKVMRGLLPSILSTADLKTFRELDAAAQNVKLDAWVAGNAEALAAEIAKELEQAKARKAAKEALGKAVTVKL